MTDPLPPTTTTEEDRKTAGQRRVNVIWEVTQAIVAISVTLAMIYCVLEKIESPTMASAFTLVLSTYLIRTNHSKTGGVGGTDSR